LLLYPNTLRFTDKTLAQQLERVIATARLSDAQLCPSSLGRGHHQQAQTCSNVPRRARRFAGSSASLVI